MLQQHLPAVQVDVLPAQRAELPSAGPSTTASRRNSPSLGLRASAVASNLATCSTGGGATSLRGTDGGVASRAGLCGIQPQATACRKDPDSTVWTARTVLADSGWPPALPRRRSSA
jgi:hypothetical protein